MADRMARRRFDLDPPVVVFTGAGVSTASGVPDYRGADGIWKTFDPEAFHIERWHADPRGFWAQRKQLWERMGLDRVAPNAAHRAIARAVLDGAVAHVVTQNIDGLHAAAGVPAGALTEIHGNAAFCVCMSCGAKEPSPAVYGRIEDGSEARCGVDGCGGWLKPDVVLFGEPVTRMPEAMHHVAAASTLVVAGTSLQVYPAAGLVTDATSRGAELIIVNDEATPFDGLATHVLRGRVEEAILDLFPVV